MLPQIEFDEDELMELIKDHLQSKGLHSTVTALQEELQQRRIGSHSFEPIPFAVGMPFASPMAVGLVNSKKRARSTSPEALDAFPSENGKKVQRRLSHEMSTVGDMGPPATPCSSSSAPAVLPTMSSVSTVVPLSHYQRNKNIRRAFKEPTYGALDAMPSRHVQSVPQSPAPTPRQKDSKPSKLSGIMQRYLKLQHSQCKHPVATLPVMSLHKPHVCPRPCQTVKQNLYSLVQPLFSLSNTQWYNTSRREDNLQLLRYIYSSYRPVRTVRYIDNQLPVTASAFSHDSSKIWLSYTAAWNSEGPGIALMDYLTGVQESICPADLQDLDGYITRITLSPPANPSILVSLANEGTFRGAEHRLFLWKDTGSIACFEARCAQQFRLQTGQGDEAVDISLFWDETFNSTGNSLAVVYSLDQNVEDRPEPFAVSLLDCASGAVVSTLGDLGNQPTYDLPRIKFVGEDDNMLLFDGKLWDLRMSQLVHRFDKLSYQGSTAVHPRKPEVIIDNAVWDLRNFNLLQTVPLLDSCNVEWNPAHDVLFAHKVMGNDERNHEYNFFHVLDSNHYQHMHTEMVDKESMVLWELQADRHGLGYMSALSGTPEDSVCRVLEMGKRRVLGDDSDDEDEDEADDEDWMMGGQGDMGFDDDEDADGDDDGDEDEDMDDMDDMDEASAVTEDSDIDSADEDDNMSGDEEEDEDGEGAWEDWPEEQQQAAGGAEHKEGDDDDDGSGWETVGEEDDEEAEDSDYLE